MRLLDKNLRKYKNVLFVDGYNVINSWDELKMDTEEELEESRLKLIEILDEYQHYSKIGVVLVFDSYNVKSDRQLELKNDLIIVYTKEFETADNFIEGKIEDYIFSKRVRVATSDKLEQDIILAKGATRISAKELEVEIINAKKTVSRISKKKRENNDFYITKLDDENFENLKNYKEKLKR